MQVPITDNFHVQGWQALKSGNANPSNYRSFQALSHLGVLFATLRLWW